MTMNNYIIKSYVVVNTNLASVLHRFRDIAFDGSKIAIFGYPSCLVFYSPDGGVGTISVKFLPKGQGWSRYQTS